MTKYISKDDAILAIAKHEMFEAEEYPYASQDIEDWKEVAEMMLADVPEVDAVPVVRCKECSRQLICGHSDDYFCADGERRKHEQTN